LATKLTVIICTYNRGYLLIETLPTITQQDVSHNKYSVLIVNNNSTDNTSEVLKEFAQQNNNISIVNEPKQGLSFAKNTGWQNANSDWVVFLDDDAKVPKDFINIALKNITTNKYLCFGGIYLPWYKYGKPKWFLDEYASNKGKLPNFNTLKNDFISGGIMAIEKSILAELDGFPTKVGMRGQKIGYGEETQIQIKLRDAGYKIGYDPNWIMYHLVNRYKLTPLWFIKSGFASGRDAKETYNETNSIMDIVKNLYRAAKLIFRNAVKFTPKLFKGNYRWQNWLIDVSRPSAIIFGKVMFGLKNLFKSNVK